ncbi:hypothetical protein FGO68_gene10064 [Halteria grandinella]|uniref:Uncharacterized protein n=1 Tax=Halteria grandinella TaxID=5974 RepID=A0A8J8T2A1_HALGN|nr:hypothetical protein FGO68_gene10064 [Halteria grandinella]
MDHSLMQTEPASQYESEPEQENLSTSVLQFRDTSPQKSQMQESVISDEGILSESDTTSYSNSKDSDFHLKTLSKSVQSDQCFMKRPAHLKTSFKDQNLEGQAVAQVLKKGQYEPGSEEFQKQVEKNLERKQKNVQFCPSVVRSSQNSHDKEAA